MNDTSPSAYSKLSKWLHWLIAVIVLLMLSFSFFLSDLPKTVQPTAYMIHKSSGLTVLCLMLVRLFWIIHRGKPALPDSVPRWERIFSHMVQRGFYILLILMPLSGWIMSVSADRVPTFFGLFRVPLYGVPVSPTLSENMAAVHETIAYLLIICVVLHIAGALKHYFMDKDQVLQRML